MFGACYGFRNRESETMRNLLISVLFVIALPGGAKAQSFSCEQEMRILIVDYGKALETRAKLDRTLVNTFRLLAVADRFEQTPEMRKMLWNIVHQLRGGLAGLKKLKKHRQRLLSRCR